MLNYAEKLPVRFTIPSPDRLEKLGDADISTPCCCVCRSGWTPSLESFNLLIDLYAIRLFNDLLRRTA